jgi:hypothetical protein
MMNLAPPPLLPLPLSNGSSYKCAQGERRVFLLLLPKQPTTAGQELPSFKVPKKQRVKKLISVKHLIKGIKYTSK